MKAMILAAGLGTRLRPLTLERSKPAIPILEKPLVVRLIEHLQRQGVTEIRMNLHHLPHSIEGLFVERPGNELPVSFSYERTILGTAGGLKANEVFFDNGTFLVVNGDILTDFSLQEAVAFHRQRQALATLVLIPQAPPYQYSALRIDEKGKFLRFKDVCLSGNPRPQVFLFTGIHILEPEIFQFIPPGVFHEINDQVYPQAMRMGLPVYGFPVNGYWNDVGCPERYLEAQRDWFLRVGAPPYVAISTKTCWHESALLGPFLSAQADCVIEPDVIANHTILWEGVRLKSGTRLRNCIVGSGMLVEGEHENEIICRTGTVPIA